MRLQANKGYFVTKLVKFVRPWAEEILDRLCWLAEKRGTSNGSI